MKCNLHLLTNVLLNFPKVYASNFDFLKVYASKASKSPSLLLQISSVRGTLYCTFMPPAHCKVMGIITTPPELKQGYKELEVFSPFPLYINHTATLQQHCDPLISGRRYLSPCRTATLFLSIAYAKRNYDEHQPISKNMFSLRHIEHVLRTLPQLT
jgi:hypothetical protein